MISGHTFDRIAKDDLTMSKWYRLASYLAQFQFMIIIYKEISHGVNQIYSGHNCLVIPVSPQFPDVIVMKVDFLPVSLFTIDHNGALHQIPNSI